MEENNTTTAIDPTGQAPQAPSQQAATTATLATTIPDEFKGSTNQELIDYLDRKIKENEPKTKEELAKIERRQKAEGIISSISDAVRSVANLAATHNYAPNMFNPTDGMTARAKARFEKEKADRQAAEDKWYNYAITRAKLRDEDRDRGLQLWQLEQKLMQQKLAEGRAAELHPQNIAIKAAQLTKENNLADKAGYDAQTSKAVADYAPTLEAKKGATEDAKAESYRARAYASNAAAEASKSNSNAKVHHFMGKEYYSDKDYFKDVVDAAKAYNDRHRTKEVWMEKDETDPATNEKKKVRRKRMEYEDGFQEIKIEDYVGVYGGRKARRPEEFAGEVERRLKEEAENEKRPPSRRNNKG